jgi:galactonate dehydratase
LLTGPCTNDPYLSEARQRRSAAFIEIHTDTELVGLGETYAGYFCPELVPGVVEFYKPILLGQTVDNIDARVRRGTGHAGECDPSASRNVHRRCLSG